MLKTKKYFVWALPSIICAFLADKKNGRKEGPKGGRKRGKRKIYSLFSYFIINTIINLFSNTISEQ
jgi:hypothetical protein